EDIIEQVTVGVDPSGGGDEVGIVASALLNDGRFAVLADRTTTGSPAQWGEAAVKCHDDFDADDVVVEINFGGDMATEVERQASPAPAFGKFSFSHFQRPLCLLAPPHRLCQVDPPPNGYRHIRSRLAATSGVAPVFLASLFGV